MNVEQLKARLATEAAAAPGGSPDARARLDERIARQVRTARAAVGATGVALVIVLTIAFVNRPSADGTRVGTASRPAGSMMLRSPTPQAAACLNNGQLKAAVLEGITAGRHWILGIQGGSAGMGDHVDTMVVAFPPEHVTESCGERFGGSPLGAVAQRGWPNPKFNSGGGGGSRFPSFVDGITTPDVTRMRFDFDNGSTATVDTVPLPARYPYRMYLVFPVDYGYPMSAGAEHVDQVVALDESGRELASHDFAQTRRCPDGSPFQDLPLGDARLAEQVPAGTPMQAVAGFLHAKFPSLENVPRQDYGSIPAGWLVILDGRHGFFELHQQGTGWVVARGSVCPGGTHP